MRTLANTTGLRVLPSTWSHNTAHVVRYAPPNCSATSHTPKTLGDIGHPNVGK